MKRRLWAALGLVSGLAALPGPAAAWRLENIRPVTPAGSFFMNPSWSPDGRTLAVTTQKFRGILLADLRGGTEPLRVTDEPGAGFGFGFVWSELGNQILFRSEGAAVAGRPRPARRFRATLATGAIADEGELRLPGISQKIPPPGAGPWAYIDTAQRLCLHDGRRSIPLTEGAQAYYDPRVSPRGDRILVHGRDGHLYLFPADGSKSVDLGEGYGAVWSPDGAHVLFDVSRDDGHFITSSELFIVRPDGEGGRQQVTRTPNLHEMRVDWCPDGVRIAFDDPGSGRVFVADLVP